MPETAVALILAHLLADFVFQTDAMVRDKRRPLMMLIHGAIVAALSWAALGFASVPALIAVVAISHVLIDAAKLYWGRGGLTAFLADQTAHLAVIAALTAQFPESYALGVWSPLHGGIPAAMALGAGLIGTLWAGGHAVAALMTQVETPPDPSSLPRGGRLIGKLERLVILMLVLAGQPEGIGFLIAAKSILRFNELTGTADRHVSEYVIIGTLASFAWAIATGYATLKALALVGA